MSFLIPLYRGPDEFQHVDRLRDASVTMGAPDPTVTTGLKAEVRETMRILGPLPPWRPPMRSEDIPERGQRPRFDEITDAVVDTSIRNHLGQHPPLYYVVTPALAETVASLAPESTWPWDREVMLYRWIGALYLAPLPLLAGAAMSYLGRDRTHQALAALMVSAIGGLTLIGSLATNDSLAVLAASVLILAVVAYQQTSREVWILVGSIGAAAAAFTKSTSLTVALAGMGLLGLSILSTYRWKVARLPWATLVSGAAIFLLGCSWHLRHLITQGDIQPNGIVSDEKDPNAEVDVFKFLSMWVNLVGASFWGQAGRRSGVTPAPVLMFVSALTMIGTFVAGFFRRSSNALIVWGLGAMVAAQVGLMFRTNLRRHLLSGGFTGLQGRYVLPCVLAIVILSVLGASNISTWSPGLSMTRFVIFIAALAVGIHATLAYTSLTNYWAEPDASLGEHLQTLLDWSPWGNVITTVALASPVLLTMLGGTHLWLSRRVAPR